MDYIEVKANDLVIGQVYTDLPPDQQEIKPIELKLIDKNNKTNTLKFENLSNFKRYIELDNLIYFSIDESSNYRQIVY